MKSLLLYAIHTSSLSSSLFLGDCISARSLTFYGSDFNSLDDNILQKYISFELKEHSFRLRVRFFDLITSMTLRIASKYYPMFSVAIMRSLSIR